MDAFISPEGYRWEYDPEAGTLTRHEPDGTATAPVPVATKEDAWAAINSFMAGLGTNRDAILAFFREARATNKTFLDTANAAIDQQATVRHLKDLTRQNQRILRFLLNDTSGTD